MLAFKETEPKIETPTPKAIIVDGVNVGKCEPWRSTGHSELKWHASVYLNRLPEASSLCGSSGLIQGFGFTPEDAVFSAVQSARAENEKFFDGLSAFQNSIGGAKLSNVNLHKEQALAWQAVFATLDTVAHELMNKPGAGRELACRAIEEMASEIVRLGKLNLEQFDKIRGLKDENAKLHEMRKAKAE